MWLLFIMPDILCCAIATRRIVFVRENHPSIPPQLNTGSSHGTHLVTYFAKFYPSGSSGIPPARGGHCKGSSFTRKSILRSSGDWPITLMFRNIISTSLGKWRNNRSLNSKYFANYPCGYFALNTNDLVHADFILWKSHLSLYHHASKKANLRQSAGCQTATSITVSSDHRHNISMYPVHVFI